MPTRPKTFRPHWDQGKKERDAFYSSAAWMLLRRVFLAANPLCVPCLDMGVVTEATIAHHRQERLARPDLALVEDNLEAMCDACHTKHHKTSKI